MTTPATPPPQAITDETLAAVAEAIPCDCDHPADVTGIPHRDWCVRMTPWPHVRTILKAAWPHLAAAERERCAQLAEQHEATYPGPHRPCGCDPACRHYDYDNLPFAGLLRQEGGGT